MTDRRLPHRAARYMAMALLAGGSFWPHVLLAQSSDSATIDATATLSKAPPVLTLKPSDNLRFGIVQIPRTAATQCLYQITKAGVLEVFQDGKTAGTDACQFLDSAQGRGRVIVNCEPGLELAVEVTPTTLTSDKAVSFSTSADFVSTNDSTLNAGMCLSDGTMDIAVGGQLFVNGEAQPIDSETAIGRILLDVSYSSGDGCQYCT